MDVLENRARQMIAISEERLSRSDENIQRWLSLRVENQFSTNLGALAGQALVAGQVEARFFSAYEKARAHFSLGASFGMKAIAFEAEGFPLSPRAMEIPLYCALLAGMYDEAGEMAKVVLGKARENDSAAFYDGFARLASAAIIDDGQLFNAEREWVNARRSKNASYWWDTVHGVYHDLQAAVLSRDVDRFLSLMDARETAYAKRPADRKMRDVDLKDGGNKEQNALVIDYMGAAIAKLARHRGMKFEYDSTFVPSGIL